MFLNKIVGIFASFPQYKYITYDSVNNVVEFTGAGLPPVDLYLSFEIPSLKNQVRRN